MQILVGAGIFHIVEVEKEPETGDLLNLGSSMLRGGVWEVRKEGTIKWGDNTYPHYLLVACIRPLPEGSVSLPCFIMNC